MDLKESKLLNRISHQRHPWELVRFEVVLSLIQKYCLKQDINQITILDIGCGDVFFVEELSKKIPDADFFAVDTAFTSDYISEYTNYLNSKNTIKLFNNLDDAFRILNKSVNIVLLLDVLEHIENPNSLLNDLLKYKQIDANTMLFITVPAYNFLYGSHDTFLGHYKRYSNKELKSLTKNSGYENIETGYFFSSLVLIRIFQIFLEKVIKPENNTGVGAWKGNKFKDRIVYTFLVVDYKISFFLKRLKINLFGLSNYTVCKKYVS